MQTTIVFALFCEAFIGGVSSAHGEILSEKSAKKNEKHVVKHIPSYLIFPRKAVPLCPVGVHTSAGLFFAPF